MRPLLPPALTRGPFTPADLRASGLPEGVLRSRLVHRVFRGVFVAAGTEVTDVVATRAALRVLPPDTVATAVTALRIRGVDVGRDRPLYFCSRHPYSLERSSLVVLRVAELPPHSRGRVSPEHAFVSAARYLDLLELVVAGDWLVRLKLVTPESLVAYAASYRGWGARDARRGAALVRRRVDSPQETRLRLCLVLAGLPEPLCNNPIMWHDIPLGQPDLMFEQYRVLLEYEGDQHRTDRWQWNVDIGRHDDFRSEGWEVIRVTAAHMKRPRRVVHRTYEALKAAGYDGPEPAFSAEWVGLFENFPD